MNEGLRESKRFRAGACTSSAGVKVGGGGLRGGTRSCKRRHRRRRTKNPAGSVTVEHSQDSLHVYLGLIRHARRERSRGNPAGGSRRQPEAAHRARRRREGQPRNAGTANGPASRRLRHVQAAAQAAVLSRSFLSPKGCSRGVYRVKGQIFKGGYGVETQHATLPIGLASAWPWRSRPATPTERYKREKLSARDALIPLGLCVGGRWKWPTGWVSSPCHPCGREPCPLQPACLALVSWPGVSASGGRVVGAARVRRRESLGAHR
jgi:hypothetical protein